MKTRIDWVRKNCALLSSIEEEFASTRPFAGKTIGTGIHLEPKTVALLLTLQRGGARVVRQATSIRHSQQRSSTFANAASPCLAVRLPISRNTG